MDFLLRTDSRNDLDITNGQLSFVTGAAAVGQRIRIKLQAFVGESVYDLLGGTPWLQLRSDPAAGESATSSFYIFENTTDPVGNIRFILAETIRTVEGVDALIDLNVELDTATRVASVSGKAKTDGGEEIEFGVSVGP